MVPELFPNGFRMVPLMDEVGRAMEVAQLSLENHWELLGKIGNGMETMGQPSGNQLGTTGNQWESLGIISCRNTLEPAAQNDLYLNNVENLQTQLLPVGSPITSQLVSGLLCHIPQLIFGCKEKANG